MLALAVQFANAVGSPLQEGRKYVLWQLNHLRYGVLGFDQTPLHLTSNRERGFGGSPGGC